jgi:hypothetical protein
MERLGRSGTRAASKSSCAILADLVMRGLAISLLIWARLGFSVAFFFFLRSMFSTTASLAIKIQARSGRLRMAAAWTVKSGVTAYACFKILKAGSSSQPFNDPND